MIIAVGGVYDPRIHLDDVVMPVLKKWRIFERDDFTGEAAMMRDDLGLLIEELEETCDKFEVAKQRRLERERQVAEKKAGQEPAGLVISVLTSRSSAGPVADRAHRARQSGGAGPDGRRDERRIPHAVPELDIARAGTVSGLYVCEMVTARALVERHPVTMHMTTFAPDESPRSLQLYTVDPDTTFRRGEDDRRRGHRRPHRHELRLPGAQGHPPRRRRGAAVQAPAVRPDRGRRGARDRRHRIPVTVKFRIGIDDAHRTHLDAGRIADQEGAAAVALHARTAAQRYSGSADWEQIAQLKQHVTSIPVLGNGDIFDADDALAMMATTVVTESSSAAAAWDVRGCSPSCRRRSPAAGRRRADLGEVADIIRRHGALLAAHFGEDKGMRDIRKHIAWYLHGFPAGADLRRALALVKTLDELEPCWTTRPRHTVPGGRDGPAWTSGLAGRGDASRGMADDPDDCTVPAEADLMHSGG